ncbi:MAG: spore cortex biosynthesis protein YabQ [Oscillospiraceae bacterium]|nr:spore cortex biosynthesis protein YabQ [Oscillospiraceae bacterium]
MMTPAEAGSRLLYALAVGAVLGFIYGFLRPLRPRHTALADGLFVLCALWGWVYLMFGLCKGNIRFGLFAAMGAGGVLWEISFGRLLRPVFGKFWGLIGAINAFFLRPLQLFLRKIQKIAKKLLASGKKWVTIAWSRRIRPGGRAHDKNTKSPAGDQICAPPLQPGDQSRSAGGRRTVYGGTGGAARLHPE